MPGWDAGEILFLFFSFQVLYLKLFSNVLRTHSHYIYQFSSGDDDVCELMLLLLKKNKHKMHHMATVNMVSLVLMGEKYILNYFFLHC